MAYSAWFKGLMLQPPTVMGRRLLPFSLAHTMALEVLGSPYCTKGAGGASRGDLHIAALVCSLSWRDISKRILYRDDWDKRMKWHCLRTMRCKMDDEHARFVAYVDDYTDTPSHQVACDLDGNVKASEGMRAPWQFHTVRVLCNVYGMTLAEAWDCPVGYAECLTAVNAEAHGDKSLVSRRQEELETAMEEGRI